MELEHCDAGSAPGAPAPYIAIGHLYLKPVAAVQADFAPHAQAIMADIPHYTNSPPASQISNIRI